MSVQMKSVSGTRSLANKQSPSCGKAPSLNREDRRRGREVLA